MPLIEQYNNELYHYGVKGMKWGIRKSRAEIQADRLARYKKSEISSIERRRRRESKSEDRAVNRRMKKYTNAVEKYGADSKKTIRAEERLIKAKTNAIVGRKIAEAEIKRVGKMSLSDVTKERRHTGSMVVKKMLLAAHVRNQRESGDRVSANIGTVMYRNTDIGKYKTSSRVGNDAISEIRNEAEFEARRSIRRKR